MEQLELPVKKRLLNLSPLQVTIGALVIAGSAYWGGVTSAEWMPFSALRPLYDARAPEQVDIAPLFAAWKILDENFAPATTTATTSAQQKLYGAIQGLASAYGDDYTVFFPPVEKKLFDTQVLGGFEGVGMEVGKREGVLIVIAPIKGTPAFLAGIKSGDFIIEIDSTSTANLAVDEAVNLIRGKKGTTVHLTLVRDGKENGKPFTLGVVRDTITLPTADSELRPDGVFVIRLYMFNANSPRLFAEALETFRRSGSEKLIIDLRNNPGGYLEAAVDIASWFIPSGAVVVTQEGTKQAKQVHRSAGFGAVTKNVKIAILIDGGSASASEILAGALRDHNRATLIGQKTFGKGSVQQVFDVTSDTSLKITVARWLTPNGLSISHQGIEPDIAVKFPENYDSIKNGDHTLDRAVKFMLTGE